MSDALLVTLGVRLAVTVPDTEPVPLIVGDTVTVFETDAVPDSLGVMLLVTVGVTDGERLPVGLTVTELV